MLFRSGIFGERLFAVFDINGDGYLEETEFITSMFKIYSSDFNIKMKFVFDLYDFDKDRLISKEDVTLVLSHAPLYTKKHVEKEGKITQSGEGSEEYADRSETQKELYDLTKMCFKDKEKINIDEFKNAIENETSEMFLCPFSLLKTHFPSVDQFQKYELRAKNQAKALLMTPTTGRRLAPPKALSKFSSMAKMVEFHTPKLESRSFMLNSEDYGGTDEGSNFAVQRPYFSKIVGAAKCNPPLATASSPTTGDAPAISAVRLANVKIALNDVTKSPTQFLARKDLKDITKTPSTFLHDRKIDAPMLFCQCGNTISDFNKLMCDECIIANKDKTFEGHLYRLNQHLIKLWFVIGKKDLYCYDSKDSQVHNSMHNLVGCFIREDPPEKIDDKTYYPFSLVVASNKFRKY